MELRTAQQFRDAFVNGICTAEEIVRDCLGRIQERDKNLGAFLRVFEERALEKAKKLDAKRAEGKPLGKMAGVPVGIKDNIHVEGELSTCASKFLSNYRAPFDATVVRLLEEEDALIIGKCNMDEFAMGSSTENSAMGVSRNPWNPDYVPGGSSGGSAVAVAARMVPIALGSDTGGSVRQPAALCGIFGFKPTYGRVSRFGLVAFGSSLDQVGIFASTAEDVAMTMEVLGQACERDSTNLDMEGEEILPQLNESLQGKKFGVPRGLLEGLHQDVIENFEASLDVLRKLGAAIVDVDLNLQKYAIPAYYILATAEASTNLARFDGIRYGQRSSSAQSLDQVYERSKREGFGPEVKKRILLGTYVLSSGYQDAYYKKAQQVRTLMIQNFANAFESCDGVVLPTTPHGAFKIGEIKDPVTMYMEDIFTTPANLSGLPGVSVPAGFTSEGLPLGLQFLGPQKADAKLCAYAHAFERATEFSHNAPAIAG